MMNLVTFRVVFTHFQSCLDTFSDRESRLKADVIGKSVLVNGCFHDMVRSQVVVAWHSWKSSCLHRYPMKYKQMHQSVVIDKVFSYSEVTFR